MASMEEPSTRPTEFEPRLVPWNGPRATADGPPATRGEPPGSTCGGRVVSGLGLTARHSGDDDREVEDPD